MDKVVYLIAGNKGGVGKSAVAKSLVEWLRFRETPAMIVDGDKRTPDVHAAFNDLVPTEQFDLNDESGWPLFSDFLCQTQFAGHIVTNLPDGISERVILYFQRLEHLANNFDFEVKVLFVINTLPDGLRLFDKLSDSFKNVYPVKNLVFGVSSDFSHFDAAFGIRYENRIIHFPKMPPKIMMLVRESSMPFQQFAEQTGDSRTNFTYAKLIVSDWRESMFDSFDEILLGDQ